MNETQINAIVEQVVRRLSNELGALPSNSAAPRAQAAPAFHRGRAGVFDDMDAAVAAAGQAFQIWGRTAIETRMKVVDAMREATRRAANELATMAVTETKLGNVKDKIQKNLLCANKTPGPEILKAAAFTGDNGLALIERAPFGVIGAITPTTNPTETIINNSIGMISGGNAVVFNVHPSAKNVSNHFVVMINEAITAAGGPPNLICSMAEPTIESAGALMKHKG